MLLQTTWRLDWRQTCLAAPEEAQTRELYGWMCENYDDFDIFVIVMSFVWMYVNF
jgi:hypothetical protein